MLVIASLVAATSAIADPFSLNLHAFGECLGTRGERLARMAAERAFDAVHRALGPKATEVA